MIFSGLLPIVRADGEDSQAVHTLTFSTVACTADEISSVVIPATSSVTLNFAQIDEASFLCIDASAQISITLNGDDPILGSKLLLVGAEVSSLTLENTGAVAVTARVLLGGVA